MLKFFIILITKILFYVAGIKFACRLKRNSMSISVPELLRTYFSSGIVLTLRKCASEFFWQS